MSPPSHNSLDAYDETDIDVAESHESVDDITDAVEKSKKDSKSKPLPFISAATLIKDKHRSHIDRDTVSATRLDADEITPLFDDINAVGRDDGRDQLHRLTAPESAKKQRDTRLADAKKGFDMSLLKDKPIKVQTLPVPANDNRVSFNETESCPLLEQLNRTTFEPDETQRQKLSGAVHHIRELIDTAGADVMGQSVHRPGKQATPDHDLDRMNSGKVYYGQGQSLDRKWRVYGHKNDEPDALRYDGPVRTAKKSPGAISNGFDVIRDDPFAQRRIDAQVELDDISAVVGPLWLPLLKAVTENAGFTDIAASLGYKQPAVGSAFVKLALEIAARVIEAKHAATNFRSYVQEHRLPVAARRYERALRDAQPGKIAA